MVAVTEPPSPSPPAIGTCIDNGTLELVEILGYGGYGVVYRAVDIFAPDTSYAVKCLPHSRKRNAERQRQLHLREIMLHQLASAHSNVVTLHRVIEDYNYTFIVMDYCSDGDLFTQILHNRRYLGNNKLIKEVFLQLLDAVEYCHSLTIYHRDLKPENVLCFDGGKRLAITDFGLATTDKMSTEFRTGSVYHMSPECQGGYFAPTKAYSPLFNDIWSLGIILLNLITGRNPWKSASIDDCTFQAYLQDPLHFLPTVLPISEEVNLLLNRTLEVDWRRRITLREMRLSIMAIDNFYSSDVMFEDSMARCPWEAGVHVDTDSESEEEAEAEPRELPEAQDEGIASTWSNDSASEMVFAEASVTEKSSWAYSESYTKRDSYQRSMSPAPDSPLFTTTKLFDMMGTPSSGSAYSVLSSSPSIPSLPVTPEGGESLQPAESRRPKGLTLNTADCHTNYYDSSVVMLSARSSTMHTALDSASQFDNFGYSSIFADALPKKSSLILASTEDFGMIMTPITAEDRMDTRSINSCPTIEVDQSMEAARPESPILGLATSGADTAMKSPTHVVPAHRTPVAGFYFPLLARRAHALAAHVARVFPHSRALAATAPAAAALGSAGQEDAHVDVHAPHQAGFHAPSLVARRPLPEGAREPRDANGVRTDTRGPKLGVHRFDIELTIAAAHAVLRPGEEPATQEARGRRGRAAAAEAPALRARVVFAWKAFRCCAPIIEDFSSS